MAPRWIVQSNLGSGRDIDAMEAACAELGLECERVVAIPFSSELPDVPVDAPAIFYGSSNFVTHVHRSGRWKPGAFFDEDAFQFNRTLAHYGDHCLNADARFTTMAGLAADDRPDETRVFVRPVADLKEFAGTEFELGEFRAWFARLSEGGYELGPETAIVAAPIKRIEHEWRLFVVEGRVVAGSHYRAEGVLAVSPGLPPEVVAFGEAMAAIWSPALVFVIDVAQSGGRLAVIEINGFNSSGFYASDIRAVVEAVSDATCRHFV